jgi:antitoxin CcdA
MPPNAGHTPSRRRSVNLTIREDIIDAAKALHLNASQAAEAGIVEAIRKRQEEEWMGENRKAITAHNKRIEKDGPLLTPGWAAGS